MAKKTTTRKKTTKKTAKKTAKKSANRATKKPAKKTAKKSAKKKTGARTHAGGSRTRKKISKKKTRSGAKRATPGKMVYYFGRTRTEGGATMKDLLGGKGANLADMTSIGLPVPPGMTITTETCGKYSDAGGRMPKGLMNEVAKNMGVLERELKKKFGDNRNPLLVSVRSGAKVSMPGMMDTILNLGPRP